MAKNITFFTTRLQKSIKAAGIALGVVCVGAGSPNSMSSVDNLLIEFPNGLSGGAINVTRFHARFEAPSIGVTNYLFLRVQPNAFLFGRRTAPQLGPFPSNVPKDCVDGGAFLSKYGNTWWYRYFSDVYEWTPTSTDSVLRSDNIIGYMLRSERYTELAAMANFGVGVVPPGELIWDADRFTYTNINEGVLVVGEREKDQFSRVRLVRIAKGGIGQQPRELKPWLAVIYKYPEDSALVASEISCLDSSTHELIWKLCVLEFETNAMPIGPEGFSLSFWTNGVKSVFLVTNNGQLAYRDGTNLVFIRDSHTESAIKEAKRSTRVAAYVRKGLFLGLLVSTAVFCFVLFYLHRNAKSR